MKDITYKNISDISSSWKCCTDELPPENSEVLLCWVIGDDDWTELEGYHASFVYYWLDINPNSKNLLYWRFLIKGIDYPILGEK